MIEDGKLSSSSRVHLQNRTPESEGMAPPRTPLTSLTHSFPSWRLFFFTVGWTEEQHAGRKANTIWIEYVHILWYMMFYNFGEITANPHTFLWLQPPMGRNATPTPQNHAVTQAPWLSWSRSDPRPMKPTPDGHPIMGILRMVGKCPYYWINHCYNDNI